METVICEKLSKKYHHRPVLQDISFQVSKGESAGFYGATGSGKSTLARILSTHTHPTSGTMSVCGYHAGSQTSEVRRRVGYIPQQTALYTHMSAKGYLDFVARLYKVKQRADKVAATLDLINLAEQQHCLIEKLTPFQRQKVSLGQAIIHNPDVLILDEPTASFKPDEIIELYQLIRQLSHRHTLLVFSKSLSELSQLCDRVLVLSNGFLRTIPHQQDVNHTAVKPPVELVEQRLVTPQSIQQ